MDPRNLTRAKSAVTRRLPDGTVHTLYACAGHVLRAVQELGAGSDVEVTGDVDPAVHGCKGCLEDW